MSDGAPKSGSGEDSGGDDLDWESPRKTDPPRDSIPVDVSFDSVPPSGNVKVSAKPDAIPTKPPRPSTRSEENRPTVRPEKPVLENALAESLPPEDFESVRPPPPDVPKPARAPSITGEAIEEPASSVPVAVAKETCGRYRLCFELAQGGMASVYLARQEGPGGFDKLVALKRVHSHLRGEEEFVEMFLDEARVSSRITHPNVCSVIDFGHDNGQYFLAMDYLFGESLSAIRTALFAEKDLLAKSLPFAVKIVADACEGLHAAHELADDDGVLLNVVHRDISPQNIFVSYDGTAKVVDFGIAKARGRLHRTATGVLKGHLAYMAPEQFGTSDVDRRADIWALGVVLWELAAGTRLFEQTGNIASTVSAVMSAPIRSLSGVRPELPPDLNAIVMRALSRDFAGRYATTREMGRDLLRFLHKHCEPTGPADLSEWMQTIFAKERAEKLRLLREARRAQ